MERGCGTIAQFQCEDMGVGQEETRRVNVQRLICSFGIEGDQGTAVTRGMGRDQPGVEVAARVHRR